MKLVFKLFSILFVLVLIGVGIFVWTFDINQYRQTIADELSALLKRPVSVEKIEMKASFIPTIRLKNLVVGNPEGFDGEQPFLTADLAEGTIALAPLVDKRIQIYDIKIGKAEVNLIDANGKNNMSFGAPANASNGQDKPAAAQAVNSTQSYLSNLNVDDISAVRIAVRYQKENDVQFVTVRDLSIRQLRIISFILEYDNKVIRISGNADLLHLAERRENFVFNTEVELWGLTGKLSGSIGDMKTFRNVLLNVDLYADKFSNTLEMAGLPKVLPVSSFALSLILKGDSEALTIENFKMTMDNALDVRLKGALSDVLKKPNGHLEGNATLSKSLLTDMYSLKPMVIAVSGSFAPNRIDIEKFSVNANRSDADIVLSVLKKADKYILNGKVDSNFLDRSDFIQSDDVNAVSAKTQAPVAEEKPKKSDKSILANISGQIDWNLKNVKLFDSSDDYYGFFGKTKLENETLTVSPFQMRSVAGVFNGYATASNILTQTPKMQVRVSADNVDLDKFKAVTEYVVGSTANLTADLTTKGLTKEALLTNLNGTAEIEVTQGRVVNKWFNGLPEAIGLFQKNKSFSYSKTDMESLLNCAVINVKAVNGVLTMDKSVAVETSTVNVLLNGSVNLPKEEISVSILPQLPTITDSKLLNLAQVIRVEGSYKSPSVKIDAGDALAQAAQKGVDKLFQKIGLKEKKETPTANVSWCEMALGHKLKGKVSATEAAPMQTQQQAVEKKEKAGATVQKKLSPQDELKNQLIKSLSSVLK